MVTGHRPNGMPARYGYGIYNESWTELKNGLKNIIKWYRMSKNDNDITLITGMALGVDQVFWLAASELRQEHPEYNIKIEAAIPFKGQESKWPRLSQQDYKRMVDHSDIRTIVSDGGYSSAKMETRNRYMVDKSNLIIAICNKNTGGTANCIKYAKSKWKTVFVVNPETMIGKLEDL